MTLNPTKPQTLIQRKFEETQEMFPAYPTCVLSVYPKIENNIYESIFLKDFAVEQGYNDLTTHIICHCNVESCHDADQQPQSLQTAIFLNCVFDSPKND